MADKILSAFFARQLEEGMALVRDSDLVELVPIGPHPPQRYVARFRCAGLCRQPDGQIVETGYAEVGIFFPDDYMRRTDPYQILMWLGPPNAWHPNISDRAPIICLGRLGPGTRLVDILYQLFEIISYKKFATDDALNHDAAAWARQHQDRFPVDRRPLKRRKLDLHIEAPAVTPGPAGAGGVSERAGAPAAQSSEGPPQAVEPQGEGRSSGSSFMAASHLTAEPSSMRPERLT